MRDNEARLTGIYVAPHGSPVPSPTPNSEDTPATSFDVIITGEEGDDLHGYNVAYQLEYWAVDFRTMASLAGLPFSAVHSQTTGNAALWTARTAANEDYFTRQVFTITFPSGYSGHILQYFAVLKEPSGDIVSFVQSEPFVLV